MQTTKLANNVTLIRYPGIGQTADVCGTPAYWQAPLQEIEALTPGLTGGLTIKIYHMDSPELEQAVKDKICSLHDFDQSTDGCQVAAELYFNTADGEIHIGLFPERWKPEDPPQGRPLPASAFTQARRVLSHGMGHHFGAEIGHTGTALMVETGLTSVYRKFRSWQTENEHENLAEDFHALAGASDARGKFSDGKPYTPAHNPPLYAFFRGALWARRTLANLDVSDFDAWPEGRLLWQEWAWVWDWARFQYVRQPQRWRSIDVNQQVWTWTPAAGWKK